MEYISIDEKIRLLKNLLEDPDDEISREILRLIYVAEMNYEEVAGNSYVITSPNKTGCFKS